MKMSKHGFHTESDEIGVYWIPADVDTPMEYKLIRRDLESMKHLVGGWLEVVLTTITLHCNCEVVMVVNEDGRMHSLPFNSRATALTAFQVNVVGDAFLIPRGPVKDSDGETGYDFFGLPPNYHEWGRALSALIDYHRPQEG
jgi:hypothetical protein